MSLTNVFSPSHRRYKDKKDEAAEPEADPERDQRTVFAYQVNLLLGHEIFQSFFFILHIFLFMKKYIFIRTFKFHFNTYCIFLITSCQLTFSASLGQISLKATERDVYEFFSRAGKVCMLVKLFLSHFQLF